ncbi:PREDICTED: complex I intermediate-associated protein 30, mitochondrial-like [Priapulus caudatus]|uniref:Complex I intermediate-associated protein 30, mitochondrial-like n=1 Tax=Priapulus caudatus TaxID=37621 RepID=A0ABM1EUS8_PRICU|nr:PREDICTED: complex I intermediate-associated protein 30, mitochondrial-like [Priapulus caudatus]
MMRGLHYTILFRQPRLRNCNVISPLMLPIRSASGSQKSITVWEPSRKSSKRYEVSGGKPMTKLEHMKHGFQVLKDEIVSWKEEQMERLRCDPLASFQHGDYETIWKFNSLDPINKWIVSTDKDHNIGKTEAKLELSPGRKALFHGLLNTEPPKDGYHAKSGFANIMSRRASRSFKRQSYLDWNSYTHLLMRVRGDGRSYIIVLHTDGYFDVTWQDQYNYVLFTRGGPYWQTVRIPFSKFFLAFKGRIQDKQSALPLGNISGLGITCMDAIPGSFQLEIDFIGVYYDAHHTEKFAYEMYKTRPLVAGN